MKHLVLAFVLAFVGVSATSLTHAQPRAERREMRQQQRIMNGAAQGQLNPREVNRLERGQARVERVEARAAADGVVTPREERRVDRVQDRQSRRIWRDRHNRR